MTTPRDGRGSGPGQGLPPHLDPRGPRRASVPPRPAPHPAPRRTAGRRWGRALSWVALSTSVLILVTAGAGYLLLQHYNGNITHLNNILSHGGGTPAGAPHDAMNVLLVGSDSRAGANGRGTGGSHLTAGQRSDTVILAHLYGGSSKALFVSLPRDSWVEIPAWTDPRTGVTHQAHHDKINSAISEGGPALLIATVERLTAIRVDHYVQVDFVGFKSMVDKLGGVDICLKKSVDDPKSKLRLSAGRHHVDGTTALAFARDRHSFAGQDLDRIKHQQQLIGSIIHKVLSGGTLLNPLKLNGFLDAATSSLQVDDRLSFGDMKNIALRVRGFSSGNVLFTTVPIANPDAHINGASVVLLDEVADQAMFDALRHDRAPATTGRHGGAGDALSVPPSAIRVKVFNGSGVPGLGRRAFNDLSGLGYVTTGIPTNRGSGAANTTVLYGPTRVESARTLAASLPGSVLQEDPTLQRTLEVVVGSSYNGAQRVTVSNAPATTAPATAPASAAATPVAKLRTASDDICA